MTKWQHSVRIVQCIKNKLNWNEMENVLKIK